MPTHRLRLPTLLLGPCIALVASPILAQPALVDDLLGGTTPTSIFRTFAAASDDKALFWADDGRNGTELWITDGTPAGTGPWAEACPGRCRFDQTPFFFESLATTFDGERAFFWANDGIHGRELWTAAPGTEGIEARLAADLCPGPCGPGITTQALIDGRLYFGLYSDGGSEPWVSDGTPEGTHPLGDLRPGTPGSGPSHFLPFDGGVAFQAYTDAFGTEWWFTDGTPEGTRLLTDLCPGPCSATTPAPIAASLDGEPASLYFTVATYDNNGEASFETLYRLRPSGDPLPGPPPGSIRSPEALGVLCELDCDNFIPFLFPAGDQLFLSSNGQLWSTDGTAAGTQPRFALPQEIRFVSRILELGNGRRLLLGDMQQARAGLWRLEDGGLVGPLLESSFQLEVTPLADDAIVLDPNALDIALWHTDGTATGTTLLDTLPPGQGSPAFAGPLLTLPSTNGGDRVLFAAETSSDFFGEELWMTTGQVGVTTRLVGSEPLPNGGAPQKLTSLGTGVAFTAFADPIPSPYPELFLGFGPAAGTGAGSGDGEALRVEGDFFSPSELLSLPTDGGGVRLFFTAFPESEQTDGPAPWLGSSQGSDTTGGVVRLDPGTGDPLIWAREPAPLAGDLLFLADQGNGQKIFRSDGTPEGTRLVADIEPDWYNDHIGCPICSPPAPPGPIYPRSLTPIASAGPERLAFVAYTHELGAELWQTDGSLDSLGEGTIPIADLRAGSDSSGPADLMPAGNGLVFSAYDGINPRSWWVWDGQSPPARLETSEAAGTVRARATAPDGRAAWIETRSENFVLWVSDGTAAGTRPLRTFADGEVPGSEMVATAGLAFVVLDDGLGSNDAEPGAESESGAELWAIDLDSGDARRPSDLRPGPRGSYPENLRVVDGRLYFSADDGIHGRELFRLDPRFEPLEPTLVLDLASGPAPSSPGPVVLSDNDRGLYFVADDGNTGRELWFLRLDAEICEPSDTHHCLQDGLFRVSARWRTPSTGEEGVGRTLPGTDDTGYFWFFDADNLELATKVLDGRSQNGNWWFYYGALSDVEYWIEVEQVTTGVLRTYYNPPGNLCGDADVMAFSGLEFGNDPFGLPATTPQASTAASRLGTEEKVDGTCTETDDTLCLLDRFALSVQWTTDAAEGVGRRVTTGFPGTDETGLFWFFDADHVELAVKVPDGRAINGRFWVYYGALSDVEYTLRILDTETGAVREYHNEPGNLCGRSDVEAF